MAVVLLRQDQTPALIEAQRLFRYRQHSAHRSDAEIRDALINAFHTCILKYNYCATQNQ